MSLSPILSIDHGGPVGIEKQRPHSHPGPVLLWASTATVMGTIAARDWLVPPGYGIWIPGGIEHGGSIVREGETSAVHFTEHCPITWTEPTGVAIVPLLRELIAHLSGIEPQDSSRALAEALLFQLLTPLTTQDIQIAMPTDPRVRPIAEQLLTDPGDTRDLDDWADYVHTSVRTLTRLFRSETGLGFGEWRTRVRIRAAIQLLGTGTPVNATARAVGYRRPSAFISAFRRVTGQTPGTYANRD